MMKNIKTIHNLDNQLKNESKHNIIELNNFKNKNESLTNLEVTLEEEEAWKELDKKLNSNIKIKNI
jgi:hypothetical protein